MGDDPRWSLMWLQDELLEDEETDEEWEEEEEEEEVPSRSFFARRNAKADIRNAVYADEEDVTDRAWLVETKKERRKRLKAERKERKRRSIKGLTFLAWAELLGILAILGWWLRWLI